MELTIFSLVLVAFVAGVVGGLVIAEAMDLHETPREKRQRKRRERREKRRQNVNFTIDKF